MAPIRVGVSGWTYPRWRGDFYPAGLPHRRELAYLAERMTSVELNGSYYSLQRPDSYRRWRDQTPPDFVLAVKASRYITAMKRLAGVQVAMANFWASGVLGLGPKLGPVLWQLPPSLEYDAALLADFLDLLPHTTGEAARLAAQHDDKVAAGRALLEAESPGPIRHVLEPRHASFDTPEARDLLGARGVGTVWSDGAGRWPTIDADTSTVRYVRLHGHTDLYASGYSARSLDQWATRCLGWAGEGREVYVYFDNDARGRAPWDAVGLIQRLDASGG